MSLIKYDPAIVSSTHRDTSEEPQDPEPNQFLSKRGRSPTPPQRVYVYQALDTRLTVRSKKSVEKYVKTTAKAPPRKFKIAKDRHCVTLVCDMQTQTDIKVEEGEEESVIDRKERDKNWRWSIMKSQPSSPKATFSSDTVSEEQEPSRAATKDDDYVFLSKLHLDRMGTTNWLLRKMGTLSTLYIFE